MFCQQWNKCTYFKPNILACLASKSVHKLSKDKTITESGNMCGRWCLRWVKEYRLIVNVFFPLGNSFLKASFFIINKVWHSSVRAQNLHLCTDESQSLVGYISNDCNTEIFFFVCFSLHVCDRSRSDRKWQSHVHFWKAKQN